MQNEMAMQQSNGVRHNIDMGNPYEYLPNSLCLAMVGVVCMDRSVQIIALSWRD